MENVISISGQKRAGKDMVTKILLKKIKGSYRVALADPMKYILADMLGLTYEELDKLKNDDSKPHRKYLQNLGQKCKEYFGKECWADYSRHVIANLPKDSTAIISDVRFPFETRDTDITINVVRTSLGKTTDSHPSENSMGDITFDFTIYNDGTLEDLDKEVEALVGKLRETGILT